MNAYKYSFQLDDFPAFITFVHLIYSIPCKAYI